MHPSVHARSQPDKAAYIMAGSGTVVSYGQLEERSRRCAQLLRGLGLMAGDTIAICMDNNPRYFELCWAAQRSGLYYTCVSNRLTAPEVEYIVRDSGARVLFLSVSQRAIAAELAHSLGDIERFSVDGSINGYLDYESTRERFPAEPVADETAGADMLYSSGTTGRPKGIRVALSGMPPDAPSPLLHIIGGYYGFGEDTVYLSPAPLYHAAPLRFCMTVQRCGGTVIVMENFDPEWALALIEQYRVTHSQWVPTMFVRMLKLPEEARARHDLSSHRVAIHAAAPCPRQVKRAMIEWWGPIVHEYYAGSEGNGLCAINSADWLAHEGSVGRPVFGVPHILDDEGRELPPGQEGTIYFSDGVEFVYHNDPAKTAREPQRARLDHARRHRLPRRGRLPVPDRPQGQHDHLGRREHLPAGGREPAGHAPEGDGRGGVRRARRGIRRGGEGGGAAGRHARGGPRARAGTDRLLPRTPRHIKCPHSVDFEPELPRHPTGKLYKRLLRDRYWTGHESRIV